MKIIDSLQKRGILYKELKENKSRFTVRFDNQSEKISAIRALMKDDCAITSEEDLKISGIKKKKEPLRDIDGSN